jgi:hypothetical protein
MRQSGWDERLVRIEDPERGSTGLCLHPEDLCVAKVLAGRPKDIRFLTAVFQAGLVDPDAVARKLPTVALRPSDEATARRAQRFLDNVPRRALRKGPTSRSSGHRPIERQACPDAGSVHALRQDEP